MFDVFDTDRNAPIYEMRRTCQTELNSFEDRNVENLMILLAGGSLKEHFDSPI